MTGTSLRLVLLALIAALGLINWHLATVDLERDADTGNAAVPVAGGEGVKAERKLPGEAGAREPGAAVARPLFWPDRRPGVQSAAKQDIAAALPRWRMAGSFSAPSGVQRALIVKDDEPGGHWIELGAVLDGWRVVTIEPHLVGLESAGRRVRIEMFTPAGDRR